MLVQLLVDLQGLQGNFLACLSLFYSFKKLLRFLKLSDLCQNLSVICMYSDDSGFPLLWISGFIEWILCSKRRKSSIRRISISMALCKWITCHYLLFWPASHCYQKQKSSVMALWYRCVLFSDPMDLCFSFSEVKNHFNWLSLFLSLVFICHLIGSIRGFIADYGVPVMVVLWTALSYSVPGKVPSQVPRRLIAPLPWEPESVHHWTVVKVSFLDFYGRLWN